MPVEGSPKPFSGSPFTRTSITVSYECSNWNEQKARRNGVIQLVNGRGSKVLAKNSNNFFEAQPGQCYTIQLAGAVGVLNGKGRPQMICETTSDGTERCEPGSVISESLVSDPMCQAAFVQIDCADAEKITEP